LLNGGDFGAEITQAELLKRARCVRRIDGSRDYGILVIENGKLLTRPGFPNSATPHFHILIELKANVDATSECFIR